MTAFLCVLLLGTIGSFLVIQQFTSARQWHEPILWIPQGQPGPAIAANIASEAGLPALPVKIALKLTTMRPLQAGEYDLSKNPSLAELFASLQSGAFIKRSVTIPEGLTSYQILQKLSQAYGLEQDCLDYKAIPEGSLLPETYAYIRGEKCTALMSRMKDAMDTMQAKLWSTRDPGIPVQNWHDAVTLASIVERETGIAAERPRVAGVFINRMRLGMPMQSDPTTIYALTKGTGVLTRPLTRNDWKLPDAYNTYYIPALPPGPIAHPGTASLMAVLHPESHNFLYFVTNGTGGHAFSSTLAQHNENILKK